jgi:hypothetical protein
MTPDPLAPFCERHGLTLEQREELQTLVRGVVETREQPAMTTAEFNALLDARLDKTRATLAAKAGEYATAGDRLHNFSRAAELLRTTRPKACLGFLTKHLVSIIDMVDGYEAECPPPAAVVDEKIGDAIAYMILLEALLLGRAEKP